MLVLNSLYLLHLLREGFDQLFGSWYSIVDVMINGTKLWHTESVSDSVNIHNIIEAEVVISYS